MPRYFDSGAYRDGDDGKLDYEGFLSPDVLAHYAQYMHRHRLQSDGAVRDSDNWQGGMPRRQYAKSLWRHFMDFWMLHRGTPTPPAVDIEEALCAIIFNAMGYLHEVILGRDVKEPE